MTATKKLMKSGAQLRAFRRHLATRADRPTEKYTRTLKFPLEDTGFFSEASNFEAAAQLYNITEGIESNSLYDLLMRVHLGGFRLFSSATKAYTFRNRSIFGNQEFKKSLKDTFSIEPKKLDTEVIYEELKRSRRNTGGRIKQLSGKEIADEYYKLATGKPADSDRADFNGGLYGLLEAFGGAIEQQFGTWKNVNKDVETGKNLSLICLDTILAEHGVNLPSIYERLNELSALPSNLKTSTIAYDADKAIVYEYPNEVAIHIVVAQYLQDIQKQNPTKSESVKYLQLNITTETNSGLSWLFNGGLKYFVDAMPDDFIEDFSMTNQQLAQQLIDIANNLLPEPFLVGTGYQNYRQSFGGKLDSWIANYATRLYELKDTLDGIEPGFCIPEALNDSRASHFFGGMTVNLTELNVLIDRLCTQRDTARDSLARLMGIKTELPQIDDVERIENFSAQLDSVAGQLGMLFNRLEQELEQAKSRKDKKQESYLKECSFTKPVWLKKLPKLNRISGGVPDYKGDLKQAVEDFNVTRDSMKSHFARITQYCEQNSITLDVVGNIAKKEQEHIDRFKALRAGDVEESSTVRAYRNIFHRIARVGMNSSSDIQESVKELLNKWGVLDSNKDLNRLFNNRQGAIYQSLFSNRRHEPYKLKAEVLGKIDYLGELQEFLSDVEKQAISTNLSSYNDLLKLERTYYTLMLSGLPDALPKELGRLDLPEHLLNIAPLLEGALTQETLRAETIIKSFNHYHSVLNGLAAKIFREEFFVRTKFSRVGDTGLIYQPKDKTWTIPDRYRLTKKAIGEVLNEEPLDGLIDDNSLDVRDGIEALAKSYGVNWGREAKSGPLTTFLRQSPHDWKYHLGYGASKDIVEPGFKCDKGVPRKHIGSHTGLVRLIGPSSFKEWLDKAMLTNDAEIGDINLIIDQKIKQSAIRNEAGLEVKTELSGGKITLAVPLTELIPKGEPKFILDHFVAIDLGEVGVGYAIYKVEGFELIEHGSITIRSIRNLMSAVDRHRKLRQPQQKFQASYNPLISQLRQNAIGDTLGVVDGLMEKFNAFPVFESSVGNFERGANQLKMVYESVLKHYIFSEVDAHKSARKHHWCGGEKWSHPSLKTWEYKDGARTDKEKQLNLFPGASVHPAGTSQTCSKCHRNPIKMVYSQLDSEPKYVFKVNANGQYELPSGESIYLYTQPKLTPKELKTSRRRKLARLPTVKINDDFRGDEMLRAIRRCLRFKQESTRSKDTSQSRYRCLFSDCGHDMHADENAAINIGVKWVKEKVVTGINLV
ncbi:MAG TPA: hypothetical protein EYF95_06415 [Flavobacteriales bacterium]|nr:hypothetical protein [Flavobacteriales bacterium]